MGGTAFAEVTPFRVDESALLGRIRARDIGTLKEIYFHYHGRLSHFLLILTRMPHGIDDLIDDAMMEVWERPRGCPRGGDLTTWIFGIAYRNATAMMHTEGHSSEVSQAEQISDLALTGERRAADPSDETLLIEATADLSPVHRAVVECIYHQRMHYLEIAEILGCSANTVMTLAREARQGLKRCTALLPEDTGDRAESYCDQTVALPSMEGARGSSLEGPST